MEVRYRHSLTPVQEIMKRSCVSLPYVRERATHESWTRVKEMIEIIKKTKTGWPRLSSKGVILERQRGYQGSRKEVEVCQRQDDGKI